MYTTMIKNTFSQALSQRISLTALTACSLLAITLQANTAHSYSTDSNLKICSGNFAGYLSFTPNNKGGLHGISYEIVKDIAESANKVVSFDILPWRRCLLYLTLEQPNRKSYTLTTAATYNEKRAESYLFTKPFMVSRGYYFYTKKRFPTGLKLNNTRELSGYNVCGRTGFNYVQFGLKNEDVLRIGKNILHMVELLKTERCDVFIARNFNVAAEPLVGNPSVFNDQQLAYDRIPGMKPENMHFMLNKNAAGAENLVSVFDNHIEDLWKNGKINQWREEYLGNDARHFEKPAWVSN